MSKADILAIQTGLKGLGYDPGVLDGLYGKNTKAAALAWLDAGGKARVAASGDVVDLPWITEGRKVFGLHETRDNERLRVWLKSDGKTLGDPKALPWCGDFVETCIRNALPSEPLPGALGANPYWARNWSLFGREVKPCYGAIMAFVRESGGHVGFLVGEDAASWYVFGGNQGNAVNISRLSKSRQFGKARWPITGDFPVQPLPKLTPGNIPASSNEF